MATPLFLMSSTTDDRNPSSQSEPRLGPNPPKSRGRKSKTQNGVPKKQPQRGMGVAQLERLLRQQQQNNPHHHHHHHHHHQQQPGFSHNGFPVGRGGTGHSEMRPPIRVLEGHTSTELPSMPNMELEGYVIDQSYKKKRVIGDEVGFVREKGKYDDQIIVPSNGYDFSGFDHHHHHHHHHAMSTDGGFSCYDYLAGSEVVAIHKKGSGSRNNVMMEYGFFPGIHEENEEWKINNGCTLTHNHHNHTDNYCDQMTDLNLKMGLWSDSSSPSPSSSSLSSLTTATTYSATAARRTATTGAASNTCSLDLSLKLSY